MRNRTFNVPLAPLPIPLLPTPTPGENNVFYYDFLNQAIKGPPPLSTFPFTSLNYQTVSTYTNALRTQNTRQTTTTASIEPFTSINATKTTLPLNSQFATRSASTNTPLTSIPLNLSVITTKTANPSSTTSYVTCATMTTPVGTTTSPTAMIVNPIDVKRDVAPTSNEVPHVLMEDPKKGEESRKRSDEPETTQSPKKDTAKHQKLEVEKEKNNEPEKSLSGQEKNGEATTNNSVSPFPKTGHYPESEKNNSLHSSNNPEVSNSKDDETSQKGPSNITGWMESLMFSK